MITKFQIRRVLSIAAVLFLATVLLNALLQRQMVSAETVARLMGMLQGIILMVCANDIPKRLPPTARMYCNPARDLACRRLIGWLMVAGGLGFTLVYALAPLPIAHKLALYILVLPIVVLACMAARIAWMRYSNRRSAS